MMEPFQCWRDLLATVPGIGRHAAAAVISEIGVTIKEFFPDDAHLASWTGLCPGNHQSAGKRRSGKPRPGNTHLQTLLVECAWSAVRHDGYLKSLFHRHMMEKRRLPQLHRQEESHRRGRPRHDHHHLTGTSWSPQSPTTNWAPATSPASTTPNA